MEIIFAQTIAALPGKAYAPLRQPAPARDPGPGMPEADEAGDGTSAPCLPAAGSVPGPVSSEDEEAGQ
jgi:hypothetical protein